MILRVITAPNSAFLQIRDNEERYFAQAIALLVISSIVGGFAVIPFVMMPLDEAYLAMEEGEGIEESIFMEESSIPITIGSSILSGFVSATLYYFIGKKLEGNANWKKVFAVVFHVHAVVIPISIIMAIVIFFMWSSFTSIDPAVLLNPEMSEEEVLPLMGPFIGYVALLAVLGVGFVVWMIIVTIKAIKTVHGFGTGKAFGLIILVGIITSILNIPFSI